jgi:hypothetical protein
LRFEFFEDDSSRDGTIFFVRCGMSGKNTIHCFEKGFVINYFTSKSTVGYLSKISHGNASGNVCVDRVSQNDTQLQPTASLVAIPISKSTIGNKSHKDIIIAVIIKDVTFATFTDATISEHFIPGSIELNLNTRCSSASRRLSKMEFCWTAEVGEFSHSSSSLDCVSFTFYTIALNIRERVAMQCDSSPPFKVFDT